jgi:hypothetical protein
VPVSFITPSPLHVSVLLLLAYVQLRFTDQCKILSRLRFISVYLLHFKGRFTFTSNMGSMTDHDDITRGIIMT